MAKKLSFNSRAKKIITGYWNASASRVKKYGEITARKVKLVETLDDFRSVFSVSDCEDTFFLIHLEAGKIKLEVFKALASRTYDI